MVVVIPVYGLRPRSYGKKSTPKARKVPEGNSYRRYDVLKDVILLLFPEIAGQD
jgi:hypothetical protein